MIIETLSYDHLGIFTQNSNSITIVGFVYARGMNYYGYIIQVKKPEEFKNKYLDYDNISILLNSAETNETVLGKYL